MEAFISKNGVTKCPSYGTQEFREMNIARELARAEAAKVSGGRHSRNRRANIRRALRS